MVYKIERVFIYFPIGLLKKIVKIITVFKNEKNITF